MFDGICPWPNCGYRFKQLTDGTVKCPKCGNNIAQNHKTENKIKQERRRKHV